MIRVRTLRDGEPMPEGFNTGFESMPLIRDWVWVAEEDEPLGVLIAAPCHGLVYMMRICAKEGAKPSVVTAIIRACMRDCEARGFKGYFFHVTTLNQAERTLIPICRKAGGVQLTHPQVVMAGSIEKAARY